MRFNFGPIARTDASNIHDTFNLAALPLHESLDALLAATNRDEFVAWLWHDIFKPAFNWQLGLDKKTGKLEPKWHHISGIGLFESSEALLASRTNVPLGLVRTHQFGVKDSSGRQFPRFTVSETDIISEQVEQINLGQKACYLQITFAVESAMTTAVVRAVIADSFIEAVVKDVAQSLQRALASKSPSFSRVRFVFETCDNIVFSTPPTDVEIWQKVGQHFDIQLVRDELILKHLTPVVTAGNFDTQVTIDLSGQALTPEQMRANILGLAELLIVYQDSRTVIMAVPQSGVYKPDVNKITSKVLQLTRAKLGKLDVCTTKDGVDLLKAAVEAQVEIRKVPVPVGKNSRPIQPVILRPIERLDDTTSGGRHCRLCASAFKSDLPIADTTRPDFTDAEYIGLAGDLCPLCRIYWYNTHQYTQDEKAKGSQGMRKSLRGSFALVFPSSHFDVQDSNCRLVERPPLDKGGRFASLDPTKPLFQRVTVTQQEYTLFTQISRRIIASLWRQIEPTDPLPLPYLGGIVLTHREDDLVRRVLPALRGLFTEVILLVYPFEAKVLPNIELALEVSLKPDKQHHTKHTFLKSRPVILPVHPDSKLLALADNKMQVEISRDWFEAYDYVAQLVNQMSRPQRSEWMRRITEGADPATAFYESTQTRLKHSDDGIAFNTATAFWAAQFGNDPAQAWSAYEQKHDDLRKIFLRYPMMAEMFPTMTEKKESKDDRSNATGKEADGSSVGRGTGSRRRTGASGRPRARRQVGS